MEEVDKENGKEGKERLPRCLHLDSKETNALTVLLLCLHCL